MAVLRYYNPPIHDIYHYPTLATQTSGDEQKKFLAKVGLYDYRF